MPRREKERERERERPLEFDFAVAGNIWIRRDAWQTRQDKTRHVKKTRHHITTQVNTCQDMHPLRGPCRQLRGGVWRELGGGGGRRRREARVAEH
jgi:hypothetical protein